VITLDQHPRARRGIRRARNAGGLVLAVATALLAHRAGVPGDEVVLRALAAGVVGHLAAWAGAIAVYRALARGEIQAALDQRALRLEDARAELERRRAETG
jgi:hypothetical protein